MKVEGRFAVRAARERVFSFLVDPNALSSCIDDPHTIDVSDPDHFQGTLRSGVGPIRGTFAWSATVTGRFPPERVEVKVHGSGMGNAFDINAIAELSQDGPSTTVSWRADVLLRGALASLGARLMQGTIDKKTKDFFENARKRLEASGP